MKLFATAVAVLLAANSVSAWRLRLYKDKNYINIMGDYSGNTGSGGDTGCYAVHPNDAASSFHWTPCYGEGRASAAELVLYKNANCDVDIGRADASKEWNKSLMSANDELTSFRVLHRTSYQC